MSTLWSDLVHSLDPYVPGEQPKVLDLIKLNTNENPYPPSPRVSDVLSKGDTDLLRLYPDPNSAALKQTIATHFSLKPSQVFVGNGSDEVLAHAFVAFFKKDKPLLFPDISYSFYPVYCNLFEIDYKQLALDDSFSIVADDYVSTENGGIIFPNPNAPTGKLLGLSAIERIATANPSSVVIVDEAYIDFGGESALSLIDAYENILVIQTLSKSRSLAGIRLGYALGPEALIEGLDRVKNSFNSYPIDRLAEAAGIASFEDDAYFKQSCDKVIATRDWTVAALEARGFEVLPSAANFVFAKPNAQGGEQSAETVFQALREKNIIVRYFNKPRIQEFLRISIGTEEEMQAFIQALDEII